MEKGLSQVDLAVALGLAPSMISHFESGRKAMSLHRLQQVAEVLNVSTDRLLGIDSGPREVPTPDHVAQGGNEITPEQAIANYQLILDEPMLALKVRRGTLTVEDMADIADFIRFVRKRDEEVRKREEEREKGRGADSSDSE